MHLLDGVPVMLETAYVPVALAPGLERRTDFSATSDSVFQILRTDYRLDVSPMEEKAFLSPVREEEEQLLNLSHGESAYLILTKMTLKDGTPAEYGRTVGRTDRIEIAGRLLWQNGKEEQE
jgi:GntR family transcriptional regulator